MSRLATPLLALAGLAAAGCTTVGNGRLVTLDEPAAQSLLTPGRTTEAEVREALGQGTVVQFRSGWRTWHYVHRQGMAKGWDYVPYVNLIAARIAGDEKELVLLFDDAGVLRRWSLQRNPGAHPGGG
jgi:outer membrane protein assembly factor BamE (lipoprotein component of BamABCDE complex)